MDEREALLAAIRDQPDENVRRLAFADWLDENDHPPEWGEFIRVQVQLATPGTGADWPRLLPRERELWESPNRPPWVMPEKLPMPALVAIQSMLTRAEKSPPVPVCVVRRGFIAEYRGPASLWVRHADELLAVHPIAEANLSSRPETEYVSGRGVELLRWDPRRVEFDWRDVEDRGREVYTNERNSSARTAYGLLYLRWPRVAFDFPT